LATNLYLKEMNKYPKISIVTPTYNREEYLEETILSVINQDYPNLEYIIIDGGSTDSTVEIIKRYENKLTYWISEPDEGMYHAIQKGFEKSTGDIMAWLNSDDKYHPGALRIVNQIFSDLLDVEWIIGMPTLYNQEGLCVKASLNRAWTYTRFQVGDYRWIQQESVFWKRSLWLKAGSCLSTKFKYASDFELWNRFFKYAQLHNVETPLSGFRLHEKQISNEKNNEYETEVLKILELEKFAGKKYNLRKISLLWSFRKFLLKYDNIIIKYLTSLITKITDSFHHFPKLIYYDFQYKKWKKE
jgi:glycosyltransferase involved in cell wall biosynthesis